MKSLRRSGTSSASSSSSSSTAAAAGNSSAPIASSPPTSSWGPLRALLVVAPSAATPAPDGTNLKSPWSRRKRKHALTPQQWSSLFTDDGKLRDGGVKFLKKVRSGGVDQDIRAEVWPFLLGVFDLNSSMAEREEITKQNRKEYRRLRKQCYQFFKPLSGSYGEMNELDDVSSDSPSLKEGLDSPCSEDVYSARDYLSVEDHEERIDGLIQQQYNPFANEVILEENEENISSTCVDASVAHELSDSETSADDCETSLLSSKNGNEDNEKQLERFDSVKSQWTAEDFASWRRIIRLDALRVDADCNYCPLHEDVSLEDACYRAEAVGLKEYESLEPGRIYHAARLVEVLESYAIYDQETGYCQGMSDLLSPILAVMKEDYEAFWCFVGFMKKARHNFRLDEAGIKRQLKIVSKIIKSKDAHLYRHLEKLQAEDCFFVYRMVVVLFRRELTFEQTLCLWEVLWADQAAIRANIGKSAWGRSRPKAPPTDDLLLYAIAASVLQRRKLIIEKYSSMDEIVRECNNMSGHVDVWKLLDDAHDLVVTLHDKV